MSLQLKICRDIRGTWSARGLSPVPVEAGSIHPECVVGRRQIGELQARGTARGLRRDQHRPAATPGGHLGDPKTAVAELLGVAPSLPAGFEQACAKTRAGARHASSINISRTELLRMEKSRRRHGRSRTHRRSRVAHNWSADVVAFRTITAPDQHGRKHQHNNDEVTRHRP